MSDTNLAQFELDLTGVKSTNLVVDEIHNLSRQRNIALAPKHGAFYTESLVITHIETGYKLRKNIDFKILQPYETISVASGKPAAGILLIHNSIIHQNVSLRYQCVGGGFSTDSKSLENYLNSLRDDNPNYSWYNILVEDETISSDIEKNDKFDFHFLCYNLERIRNAILWTDSNYYEKLRNYLEVVLDSIEVQTKLALDSYLDSAFGNFKVDINKALIGLGNVENLPIATTRDMIDVVEYESRITQFEKNKYTTLYSLNVFKQKIYERFALVSLTNIGSTRGMSISPNITNVINMVNGAVFILESKKEYTEKSIIYDDRIYPPNSNNENTYTVLKINNNNSNRGGLYLFSERSGKNLFLAYHIDGDIDNDFVWSEFTTEDNTENVSKLIATHILKTDNPHLDTKEKIGLPKIENLPVVTQNDIMCLKSCRKYVTMDALLLFMKTYLVSAEAAAEDPRNDDVEKVQIIYTAQAEPKCLPAPCPCPEPAVPPPPPAVPYPLMIKVSQQYDA